MDESGRPAKLLRRDDVEREREALQNAEAPVASTTAPAPPAAAAPAQELLDDARRIAEVEESSAKTLPPASSTDAAAELEASGKPEAFAVPNDVVIRRLRAKGQPIRLFGESDKERRLRLRALELIEERGERVGQNDFMRALAGAEGKDALEELERTRQADGPKAERDEEKKKAKEEEERLQDNPKNREGIGMDSLLDLSLVRKDVNRVYPMIYYTLKGLMSDWEQALAERPREWACWLVPHDMQVDHEPPRSGGAAEHAGQDGRRDAGAVARVHEALLQGAAPARHAARRDDACGRDCAPHAEARLSRCQRFVPANVDWQRGVADGRHHGRVSAHEQWQLGGTLTRLAVSTSAQAARRSSAPTWRTVRVSACARHDCPLTPFSQCSMTRSAASISRVSSAS